MLTIRNADDRGAANFGWLDSRHTFSFGRYHDPAHMGFRSLRVINDDRVAGGGGFDTHRHRDMEIISLVVDGALEHKDSLGNGSVLRAGDVQRVTAGRGVMHSEFNPSRDESTRFLQVWIEPEAKGLEPGYEERSLPRGSRLGELRLVAAPGGRGGAMVVHQDAELYLGAFEAGQGATYAIGSGRHVWVQVISGTLRVNGHELTEGDGAAITDEASVELLASTDADVVLFDLA